MTEVQLAPIVESNWRAALQVRVSTEQLRFVADHQPVVLVILAKSYVKAGGSEWRPYVILTGDQVVGVLALASDESTTELFHLAIDQTRQRRGFGHAAVRAAVDLLVAEARTDVIELTVHPDNTAAQRVYEAAGFSPTSERRHGEPVWHRRLATPAS